MTALDVLRVSGVVPASPERTFRAWTTPEDVKRWFGRAEGMAITNVEMDVRVGGRYRIEMGRPDSQLEHRVNIVGTYHVVSPPHRLTFSFSWDKPLADVMDVGETVVTVQFRQRTAGTEVVITHERLRDASMIEFHRFGWTNGLERLGEVLAAERSSARRRSAPR